MLLFFNYRPEPGGAELRRSGFVSDNKLAKYGRKDGIASNHSTETHNWKKLKYSFSKIS